VNAARAFGHTTAVLLTGIPAATFSILAAIYIHEHDEMRRQRATKRGLFLEREPASA
jgi:predicted outer membrane lipoprotein